MASGGPRIGAVLALLAGFSAGFAVALWQGSGKVSPAAPAATAPPVPTAVLGASKGTVSPPPPVREGEESPLPPSPSDGGRSPALPPESIEVRAEWANRPVEEVRAELEAVAGGKPSEARLVMELVARLSREAGVLPQGRSLSEGLAKAGYGMPATGLVRRWPDADLEGFLRDAAAGPGPGSEGIGVLAAWVAGQLRDRGGNMEAIYGLLGSHADPVLRRAAVIGLGALRPPNVERYLRIAREDPDPGVRDAALGELAGSVASIPADELRELLERALVDPDRQVRGWAGTLLYRSPPSVIGALAPIVTDPVLAQASPRPACFVAAAVRGGLWEEMKRRWDATDIAHALGPALGALADDHPEDAMDFAARELPAVVADWRSGEEALEQTLGIAIEAGAKDAVLAIAGSGRIPWRSRVIAYQALAGAKVPGTGSRVAAALANGSDDPLLRLGLVAAVREGEFHLDGEEREAWDRALAGAASNDPSPWVRAAAREALESRPR